MGLEVGLLSPGLLDLVDELAHLADDLLVLVGARSFCCGSRIMATCALGAPEVLLERLQEEVAQLVTVLMSYLGRGTASPA